MTLRHAWLPVLLAAGLAACSPQAAAPPAVDPLMTQKINELQAEIDAMTAARAAMQSPPASSDPTVYIVNLKDGDIVTSPVRVIFGLSNYGVAPALVDKPNTGHHHLLIDATLEGEALDYAIPNDANHLHFGGGQTETVLELAPGPHTLQLILGDMNHEPHTPPIQSQPITITVK